MCGFDETDLRAGDDLKGDGRSSDQGELQYGGFNAFPFAGPAREMGT